MQKFYQEHVEEFHEADYNDMWKNYASDYYLMDTYYRKFFEAYGKSLKETNSRISDSFMSAADYVENLYKTGFLAKLSSKWTTLTKAELNDGPGEVADPWYTRDFERTWQDALEGCHGLLNAIREEHNLPSRKGARHG